MILGFVFFVAKKIHLIATKKESIKIGIRFVSFFIRLLGNVLASVYVLVFLLQKRRARFNGGKNGKKKI